VKSLLPLRRPAQVRVTSQGLCICHRTQRAQVARGDQETFTLPDVLGGGTSQVLGAADVAGNRSG
jgi:hypothetical protein